LATVHGVVLQILLLSPQNLDGGARSALPTLRLH
jgi:hypothetical protein